MEKVQYLTQPSTGTMHYETGERALIKALESMYANNETPLGNQALARQRALGNAAVWNNWFYGCPQVQTKLDEGLILFDDRVVDVNNLKSHPLYNPAFLRDHWTEIRSGALTMPKEYVMELLALSENHSSSVRAVKHRDLTEINQDIPTATISTNPYLKAFLGLSDAERAAYIKEHETRKGKRLGLYCSLVDAQEEAQGRLSVFNGNGSLDGNLNVDYDYARVLGVPASVASLSAEGAAKKDSLAAYQIRFKIFFKVLYIRLPCSSFSGFMKCKLEIGIRGELMPQVSICFHNFYLAKAEVIPNTRALL